MQCTIRQRRHLECNSLRHAEPMKADERVGDVITTSQVENEPCCGILDCLETLDVSERQVDQETVAIVQPAEDECRNKGIEDVGLHRQILIDENAEITDCCRR